MLGGSKIALFSHHLHYYNTFLPSLAQTARFVLGLMKARFPKNEMSCDWLAVPVRCDFANSLDGITAPPLAKTVQTSRILNKRIGNGRMGNVVVLG